MRPITTPTITLPTTVSCHFLFGFGVSRRFISRLIKMPSADRGWCRSPNVANSSSFRPFRYSAVNSGIYSFPNTKITGSGPTGPRSGSSTCSNFFHYSLHKPPLPSCFCFLSPYQVLCLLLPLSRLCFTRASRFHCLFSMPQFCFSCLSSGSNDSITGRRAPFLADPVHAMVRSCFICRVAVLCYQCTPIYCDRNRRA